MVTLFRTSYFRMLPLRSSTQRHHLFDGDTDDDADDEDVHREEDAGADSSCWCACPSLGEVMNAWRRVFAPLVGVPIEDRSLAAAAALCRAKTNSTNAVQLTSLDKFMSWVFVLQRE